MPIYEYHCGGCREDFEVTQKISDAPLVECPKCKGTLEKMISQSSFVLKGSGWYMTDYGRKNAGKSEAKDSGAAKESGGCAASGSKPSCAGCPGSSA